MPINIRAFMITYPQLNILICTFLIQYPWLYDYILIQNGRQINLVLRQQMKMFVIAAGIFTILMYVVYIIQFPITDDSKDSKLIGLYTTFMVFDVISAVLVLCQIMSGAKRIEQLNADYGKAIKLQGCIFLQSNLISSMFFYILS